MANKPKDVNVTTDFEGLAPEFGGLAPEVVENSLKVLEHAVDVRGDRDVLEGTVDLLVFLDGNPREMYEHFVTDLGMIIKEIDEDIKKNADPEKVEKLTGLRCMHKAMLGVFERILAYKRLSAPH